MSGASISTGAVTLRSAKTATATTQHGQSSQDSGDTFNILIVGDFSGRGSRQQLHLEDLAHRKLHPVDRDNIDEVFTQLNVQLQLPVNDTVINFREMDNLHPDYLLEHVELFNHFKILKNRLKKPEQFAAAVAEIQALYPERAFDNLKGVMSVPAQQVSAADASGFNLDAILAGTAQQKSTSAFGDIHQFINNIVAPYAQAKVDPRLPEMLDAVNEAMAQTLRAIMHASAFQELEANWRGLDFLIRRITTGEKLKLFLLDASREELIADAQNHDDIQHSALYQRIVARLQTPGQIPFKCLQFNVTLADNLDDLHLAINVAEIAGETGAIALAAGSETIAGCAALDQQPYIEQWNHPIADDFSTAWQAFRASELSRFIALTTPRFLLRLPYGKKTSPIESFDFAELPASQDHNFYCWGNSAHLVTLILAQNFLQFGAGFDTRVASQIDKLPIHAYQQGLESYIKPCAEIAMVDSVMARLNGAGLLTIRSIQGKPAVLVPALHTVADDGRRIFGEA